MDSFGGLRRSSWRKGWGKSHGYQLPEADASSGFDQGLMLEELTETR